MSIVIFIVAALVSKTLTKKTFEPLNSLEEDLLSLDTNIFPELSPFINRIKNKR